MRIQIPAYTDHWMRGDRFGELVRTSWMKPGAVHCRQLLLTKHRFGDRIELAHVRLDKSGRTVRVILADCEVFEGDRERRIVAGYVAEGLGEV